MGFGRSRTNSKLSLVQSEPEGQSLLGLRHYRDQELESHLHLPKELRGGHESQCFHSVPSPCSVLMQKETSAQISAEAKGGIYHPLACSVGKEHGDACGPSVSYLGVKSRVPRAQKPPAFGFVIHGPHGR